MAYNRKFCLIDMSFDLAKAALLKVSEKCSGTKISGNPGLAEILLLIKEAHIYIYVCSTFSTP